MKMLERVLYVVTLVALAAAVWSMRSSNSELEGQQGAATAMAQDSTAE